MYLHDNNKNDLISDTTLMSALSDNYKKRG